MSAAILHSELSSLIHESKKKFPKVKSTAEKSLADLKALRVTSETQLAGDLLRKPNFSDPFILACQSQNGKLSNSGVICLQRLAASHALPPSRLEEMLNAFSQLTSSTFDIQIKILQVLPTLLQIYPAELQGALLFLSLDICVTLHNNRAGAVSNTASATLQQLVLNIIERLQDDIHHTAPSATVKEANLDGRAVPLTQHRYDAFEVLSSLCQPTNLVASKRGKIGSVSPTFALDLISTMLSTDQDVFRKLPELLFICQQRLVPSLVGHFSTKAAFPVTIRSLKLVWLLLIHYMDQLEVEIETLLGLLAHLVETDSTQHWRRAACAEVLRDLLMDSGLLLRIFRRYDMREGRKNVVNEIMAAFAKVAAEKPGLIGLGERSTQPASNGYEGQQELESASLETMGIDGIIGSTVTADSRMVGISTSFSLPKIQCIEQVDKPDEPSLPATYIYALSLECMTAVSESLSRVTSPIGAPRKAWRPESDVVVEELGKSDGLNMSSGDGKGTGPSTTPDLEAASTDDHPEVSTDKEEKLAWALSQIVDSCWPAFLATCTTFLNATLDAEFYHRLIRAVQKLTQVAGMLRLSVPRDALLTTMGKSAVPTLALQATSATAPQADPQPELSQSRKHGIPSAQSVSATADRELNGSVRVSTPPLTMRNLLCLRAILNLASALGSTFSQAAWLIVLETLQQADHLVKVSSRSTTAQPDNINGNGSSAEHDINRTGRSAEIAAVQAAAKKMCINTAHFGNDVFLAMLRALLSLSSLTRAFLDQHSPGEQRQHKHHKHQSSRSTSGTFVKVTEHNDDVFFVLGKTGEIAKVNLLRFADISGNESGREMLTQCLLHVMRSEGIATNMQIRAATLTHSIILGTLGAADNSEDSMRSIQKWAVRILQDQVEWVYLSKSLPSANRTSTQQIHQRVIETLLSMVERYGENMYVDWTLIFEMTSSVFEWKDTSATSIQAQIGGSVPSQHKNEKLVVDAFRAIQLVGSDFLGLLSPVDVLAFVDSMVFFGRQQDNLNISLTSVSFFQNLADLLLQRDEAPLSLGAIEDSASDAELVTAITAGDHTNREKGALWLLLLRRLGALATDPRLDIRSTTIRVVLRIMDFPRSTLSAHGCCLVLSFIVRSLFRAHGLILRKLMESPSEETSPSLTSWVESAVALLDGGLDLFAKYVPSAASVTAFSRLWNDVFKSMEELLRIPMLAISTSIFQGLAKIFTSMQKIDDAKIDLARLAVQLWCRNHPADIVGEHTNGADMSNSSHESNQQAFAAHAALPGKIRQAMPSVNLDCLTPGDISLCLAKTILLCVHPPYDSDIVKLASEQRHVVECLELLSDTKVSRSGEYASLLFNFVLLATEEKHTFEIDSRSISLGTSSSSCRNGHVPTFVAFSLQCMELAERDVARSERQGGLSGRSDYVNRALEILVRVVRAKYSEKAQRGNPLLWHQATSTGLRMFGNVIAYANKKSMDVDISTLNKIFRPAITFLQEILGHGHLRRPIDVSQRQSIMEDEDFDMDAFRQLSSMIRLILPKVKVAQVDAEGSATDNLLKTFMLNLLQASLIAEPHLGDFPSNQELIRSPLASIDRVRSGTVKQPHWRIRDRLPYLVFDALFEMSRQIPQGEGTSDVQQEEKEVLARAATPYLVRRVAHTFRCFISDQPLRAGLPTPGYIRKEMIYVLGRCLNHRSEDRAFAASSFPTAAHGGDGLAHLRILYPLLLQVWKVFKKVPRYGISWTLDSDGIEIDKLIHRWLEVCGEPWCIAEVTG